MQAPFTTQPGPANALVRELIRQQWRGQASGLESLPAGVAVLQSGPEEQLRAAVEIVHWLRRHAGLTYDSNIWKMREALFLLLKRKLPFSEQDVLTLLNWSIETRRNAWRGLPQIIQVLTNHLKQCELSPALCERVERLVEAINANQPTVQEQRAAMRLYELIGRKENRLPLQQGDPWADRALADIAAMDREEQAAWSALLRHCLRASGSAPSSRWIKNADEKLRTIGEQEFGAAILRWFPLADRPRPAAGSGENPDIPLPANADLLKGLAWVSSRLARPEVARALYELAASAYRKLPGGGPRAVKVGNACFWALGSMASSDGLARLSILKAKIKGTSPQKAIAAAMDIAARRTGMSREDLEEICVPTYGLDRAGSAAQPVADLVARLRVAGSAVECSWEQAGLPLATLPRDFRLRHDSEIKEIAQTAKDIQRMLAAQRDRIDGLYLAPRKWRLADWRSRYLEHPIVGSIARRLIWKFSRGDRAESGIWYADRIERYDGRPLEWLDDATTVELWHPISAEPDIVTAWRGWLNAHQVQQPFKQAHREIYPLTDPERGTGVYSNRYAAHILRQHQFNALCAERGWKNALRLMVDTELPPATRLLPEWGLRAEFWVQGIGDADDTNETRTFLYLTTDQMRFYRSDAVPNRAHAGGGAYFARRWNSRGTAEPLPLESIPPLVFSEIMRDVDLFVGVASVGNDPNWLDGGAGVHYREYWHGYSFGELTESARVRKEVLEELLPRLKIAGKCQLTDRFLVVAGDLRTYKIHLGSGNILMEPNDQYLCIVPARGAALVNRERLFLPFEGDQTLAVILSKALMLAEDRNITDQTIVRQLKM